jgi:hypothetical protein
MYLCEDRLVTGAFVFVSFSQDKSIPGLRYCPGFCLEGPRKTTKNLNQDSRSSSRDLNLGLWIILNVVRCGL